MLYTLTNIDKHRHISVVRYGFLWTLSVPGGSSASIRVIEALDDDEHILDGTATAPHSRATLTIDGAVLHVLFDQTAPTADLDAKHIMAIPGRDIRQIGTLYEFIRDKVFPRLAGLLQEGAQAGQDQPRRWTAVWVERSE
jgi:hypothetical protein